jgi:hypothetical protein
MYELSLNSRNKKENNAKTLFTQMFKKFKQVLAHDLNQKEKIRTPNKRPKQQI